MGFARIKGNLTSRIGARVRFGAPRDVASAGGKAGHGVVVDEIWADPSLNRSPPRKPTGPNDWGDYSFCAQLIQWEDGEFSIRLAYYRRRTGEDFWEYASQTTVNSDWRTIKSLLTRALSKDGWFRDKPEYKPIAT